MTNEHRSETKVLIDDQEYTMRPTFEALANIESDLNSKLMPIARDVFQTNVGVTEVAKIIYHGVRASGASLSLDTVGRSVVKKGLVYYIPVVTSFLQEGLGGEDAGKDEQTEEQKQESQ